MTISKKILDEFYSNYNAIATNSNGGLAAITLGLVVDSDDPLQQGRLRVFCPALNDDPKQLEYLPWCVYSSPFSGSVNNSSYTRGSDPENAATEGSVHYGMWAIPEIGSNVLVTCIDGDFRRRVWLGCVPTHQETHTLHHGRWVWEDNRVDGPLSSTGEPVQPLYDNIRLAFSSGFDSNNPDYKTDSPEWKSRAVDYQATAIRSDYKQKVNSRRSETDQTANDIIEEEENTFSHDMIGSHGYDWSSFGERADRLSPKVFGFSTPGMHAISLDDRPFNCRIRLRTTSGHQILLDDSNERIYISTCKGNNWVEMDAAGNIDVYSSTRVSINAAKDINMTSGGTIRMFADKGIHMFAGHAVESDNPPLDTGLTYGEIRIESREDIHSIAKNIRNKSHENTYNEIGINLYETVGDSTYLEVEKDINVTTNIGDHIMHVNKDYYLTVENVLKTFSKGTASHASMGYFESHSFGDTAYIGSKTKTIIKSADGDVELTADGMQGGTGSIRLSSPQSQFVTGDDGISGLSNGKTTFQSDSIELGIPSGMPMMLNSDPMIFGAGGSFDTIFKLDRSNISMDALRGDILQHTQQNAHSYNDIVDKVDDVATKLNVLTYDVSIISTAVQTAISALNGSLTIPVNFNLACLKSALFNMLPQSLLDAYATLEDLNAAIVNLGFQAQELENLVNYLQTTPGLLNSLGLSGISFDVTFNDAPCVELIEVDSSVIDMDNISRQTPENLRPLVDKIFSNGSVFSGGN